MTNSPVPHRYLTWAWTTRVHIEVPAAATEETGTPRLPTSEEVWTAVLGGTVTTWCGITQVVRQLGQQTYVVEVHDPDPAKVCKNCTRAVAAGQPRRPRSPRSGVSKNQRADEPGPARKQGGQPVRPVGVRGTGGRYVWRRGQPR